ncbi:hypothetical protein J1605_004048 [Eschrichtius robustus]|uniref:Uncharacterized protein n=1 Tax=Eschrichtius robustus TaxID=9764 RepID=A0AB34HKZ7_ESCRO|nr:hypothetical protein J1605_004048 [Eschrichtius robustus]
MSYPQTPFKTPQPGPTPGGGELPAERRASEPENASGAAVPRRHPQLALSLACGQRAWAPARGVGGGGTTRRPTPTPTPRLGCLERARLAPRRSPLGGALVLPDRGRARGGAAEGTAVRTPPASLLPLPACPPAGVLLTGEGRSLSTRNIPECCVAVKPVSPEKTETRARSSASVGNQCSTSATGCLRTTAAQVQSLCSSTLEVPTKHPSAGSSPPCT